MATNYNNNKYLKVMVHLKEQSIYQYSSSYFGLPIYVMVPKVNLTYGVLYDCIMNSLKRFVKAEELATLSRSSKEKNYATKSPVAKKICKEQDQYFKLFHMIFCKNETIDYDNNAAQVAYTDDTPLDWQNLFFADIKDIYAASQSNQISVIADFRQNVCKQFYCEKLISVNINK